MKKILSYLKSAPSNLSKCKFRQKTKISKFETKNVWFGYFWTGNLENYCQIWKPDLRICLIAKFGAYTKMLKLGTKKRLIWVFFIKTAVLGYFGARIILKNFCHIWNQHPWICLIEKYCEIRKMSKFETKSALFGSFWARILKTLL